MAKMNRDELKQALRTELEQAEGYNSDELSEVRRKALDMYYGRPRGDELEGRSDVQSSDLADMTEALVAQMLPGFSGDSICEFEADNAADVEQAQLESDIVNNVILERNMGYTMFQEAIRNALLLRNGWVKVWLDSRESVTRETLEQVPALAVGALLDQLNEQPNVSAEIVGEIEDSETVDATIKITRTDERFRVTAVDPTNMRWQSDYDSVWIDDRIRFIAERWFPTRSELIEKGYKRSVVDGLKKFSFDTETDTRARYREQQSAVLSTNKATEVIESFWCYYRYDSDGDGVAELHRVLFAGEEVLDDEIVSFIPYATGTPFLQPHQLNGLGLYDKLANIQDIKTDAWRDWLDNLRVSNFPETAINMRVVDKTSATNRRPGGILLVDGEVGGNVLQLGTQDNGPSARAAMDYADKVRSERAGASLDLQSAELQVAGQTAHGVERQMSSREQLAAMITRTIAETLVRQTYVLAHRGMREWLTQSLNVRIRGEFASSEPNRWPERERVNVKTGLSIAERMQRRQVMAEVIQKQEQLAAAGFQDILVNAQAYHSAVMDWGRASMLDTVERYFLDPRSQESQKAANDKAAAAQAAQEAQQQIMAAAATGEQQAQAMQSAIDKYKHDTELAFNYWKEAFEGELEKLKSQVDSAEAHNAQVRGNVESERFNRAASQQ